MSASARASGLASQSRLPGRQALRFARPQRPQRLQIQPRRQLSALPLKWSQDDFQQGENAKPNLRGPACCNFKTHEVDKTCCREPSVRSEKCRTHKEGTHQIPSPLHAAASLRPAPVARRSVRPSLPRRQPRKLSTLKSECYLELITHLRSGCDSFCMHHLLYISHGAAKDNVQRLLRRNTDTSIGVHTVSESRANMAARSPAAASAAD